MFQVFIVDQSYMNCSSSSTRCFLHLNIFYVLNDQHKLLAEILNVLVTPSSISNSYSIY